MRPALLTTLLRSMVIRPLVAVKSTLALTTPLLMNVSSSLATPMKPAPEITLLTLVSTAPLPIAAMPLPALLGVSAIVPPPLRVVTPTSRKLKPVPPLTRIVPALAMLP
jgi:hypothetical protein